MRVLIHYESVTSGQCADLLQVQDMHDECLMRRLRELDTDHSVVVGIDCVPTYVRFVGDEGETRRLQ